MEFASAFLSGILSKAGEYLLELTLCQGRYLFCFKSIVEDLKKEDENLRKAQEDVQQQVKTARGNTEEIEGDVQNWLKEASSAVANVRSLEEEINANESRLNGWCSNWGCKYKLSRRAAKQTSILLKIQVAGKFNNISRPANLSGIEILASEDFMTFESRKFAFDGIIEALKDDETSIIGLYGMGGVGKTTLVKAVGTTTKKQKIFDEFITVVVSKVVVSRVVNIMSLQDQIAESLGVKLEEKTEEGRAKRLFLSWKSGKKILLILDDVWERLDLTTIGIPLGDRHIGCKILMTTRDERVCNSMKCQKKIKLNVLNQNEGMDLIKTNAGIGDDNIVLIDKAKKVLEECSGLPLAIVTIGSLLKDKSIEEWEVVYQKLKRSKLDDVEGVDVDVYACLKLSYDYLKSKETKFCFLLCSLFPEDYEIDLEELLRFGLGLSLFQDGNSIEDARNQLRARINYLKASCLLLDAGKGFVKMHDLVRDAALRIASEGENVFRVEAGMRLAQWPQHEEDIEQYTAISLMQSKIEVFPNQLVCPKLKILLLDGDGDVSNEFFEAMEALKVARLKGFHLSLNSLQSLTKLVTLWLINCKLRDMSSLKMLAKLEILILHGCELDELPEELRELNKLRMLSLIGCFVLKRIPINFIPSSSRLEELRIYGSFEAWEAKGASIEDVFQLEGLFYIKENPSLPSSLACLDLSDLPNLRNIWKGPTQQVSLQSLTVVKVASCEKLRYVFTLNLARSLLHLQQLKVSDCDSLEHIVEIKAEETEDNVVAGSGNDVFLPKLRILELDTLENLNHFCSENYSSTWPVLQEFILNECPSLVAQHGGILQTAKTLQVLDVEDSDEFCKGVLPQLTNNFENLERLRIRYCEGVQVIFQLEQQFSLSSLKKLELAFLGELECLYKGPTHLLGLPNLQNLDVTDCHRLRHLLSSSLARNLLQLQTIDIRGCGELEQVMVEDDREDHVQLPLFPNLSSIFVDSCDELKTIFPVTIARLDLQQLTYVYIRRSPQLEEIFGQKDEADMTGDTQLELVLPQLKELTLFGLESLFNFCPSGYHLIFPSLSRLLVYGCPKITTRFSVDVNGAVHAQVEAPHADNQHVVDIFCVSSDDLRQELPPYIGK